MKQAQLVVSLLLTVAIGAGCKKLFEPSPDDGSRWGVLRDPVLKVEMKSAGQAEAKPATDRTALFSEDRIITGVGSSTTVELAPSVSVRIDERSVVLFLEHEARSTPETWTLALASGQVYVRVDSSTPKAARVRIKTPKAWFIASSDAPGFHARISADPGPGAGVKIKLLRGKAIAQRLGSEETVAEGSEVSFGPLAERLAPENATPFDFKELPLK